MTKLGLLVLCWTMFAELLGIGETIASLANETVAQGEISRVVERGLDNPQIFQNLVHFYGEHDYQDKISRVVERGLDNPQIFQNLVHFYGELREPYYPGPKDPN